MGDPAASGSGNAVRVFERPRRQNDRTRGQLRPQEEPADATQPDRDEAALRRARSRHPAEKARSAKACASLGRHAVVEGDTLWDLAAVVLRTDDAARIARYWPSIHRANRSVIGADPNLIIPGMVLELPVECDNPRR
jgi:nucleoid-associated protein YgaU